MGYFVGVFASWIYGGGDVCCSIEDTDERLNFCCYHSTLGSLVGRNCLGECLGLVFSAYLGGVRMVGILAMPFFFLLFLGFGGFGVFG